MPDNRRWRPSAGLDLGNRGWTIVPKIAAISMHDKRTKSP